MAASNSIALVAPCKKKSPSKKVTARLGNHLGKVDLWQQVTNATLKTQATSLRKCRFVIVDLSDISKKYAKKMEGQAGVYDGSEGETGFGYWLCNITTVNDDTSIIVPTYSELFSHTAEVTSENEKILNAVDQVTPQCAPDHILLVDRGGIALSCCGHFYKPIINALCDKSVIVISFIETKTVRLSISLSIRLYIRL